MTAPAAETMRSAEAATFWRYIRSSLDRLVKISAGMSAAELDWRPSAPETNSLFVLTTHTLGNAEENLLGALCGQPGERDRAAEFRATAISADVLAERWRLLDAQIQTALATLDPARLDAPCPHPRRGTLIGREILIVVARHAAEHLGQAELTRDLMRATVEGQSLREGRDRRLLDREPRRSSPRSPPRSGA